MMFPVFIVVALAGTVVASPSQIEKRQSTSNDLKSGGACKEVTLVYARASTEPGNMGTSMGPTVCSGLKKNFPNGVSCQGVGQPYTAGLMDNVSAAGTTSAAIGEATKMFTMAAEKCPKTIIVAGGYSQGTAVMMNAVSKLDTSVKNRVVGVVLFGYTKNKQQKSAIPNYPKERVSVYCSSGDGVCGGTLSVTAGHFSYMTDGSGPKSIAFLTSKINAGPGAAGADAGDSAPAESSEGGGEEAAAPKSKGKSGGKTGKGKGKGS